MTTDALNVHNVQVSSQTRLTMGKAVPVTHVQFYVGDHGPFAADFQTPNDTPALIQAYIQQKVADLRSITERTY